jgi:hypothetical protein
VRFKLSDSVIVEELESALLKSVTWTYKYALTGTHTCQLQAENLTLKYKRAGRWVG